MRRLANTRAGATSSAICVAAPMTLVATRSIWFFRAKTTAFMMLEMLLTEASKMMPANTSLMPSCFVAGSSASVSTSLIAASATADAARTPSAVLPGVRLGDVQLGGLFHFKQLAVGDQRENQAQDVHREQNRRDLEADLVLG